MASEIHSESLATHIGDNTSIDHSAIQALFDFASLKKQLEDHSEDSTKELINPDLIKLLKGAVLAIDEGLKTIYESSHDVNTVVYGRSYLIDQLIHSTYTYLFRGIDQEIALIAVGGYGRGELHPKSDIDLMILLKEEENQNTKDLLEKLLTLLWDIRLEIGHSVRTIDECIEE
ncbi:MAG: nucleotidyltransferase domain-containing protein, partial [Gammaproteobacteria bacterium]|nr:nucleotidyltransferase domain-containing protein [Gammaproteobacteria bacterium]